MRGSEIEPAAAPVSLKRVVDEIELLMNDAWTAYLNRRTGELYTVTEEEYALDEPDDPDLPDWQREDRAKSREIMESPDWVALPSKFDIHEYDIMARFCDAVADWLEAEGIAYQR